MPTATQAIGLVIIVAFVAFAFPAFVAAPDVGTTETTVTLNDGDGGVENVDHAIRVEIAEKTYTTTELNVTSLNSGNTTTLTLMEGEEYNITLDNQTLMLTVLDIQSGPEGTVVLSTTYPSDFGWDDGTKSLSEQMPLVFAAVALILILGFVGAVAR